MWLPKDQLTDVFLFLTEHVGVASIWNYILKSNLVEPCYYWIDWILRKNGEALPNADVYSLHHLNATRSGGGTWRSRRHTNLHIPSSIITRWNHRLVAASITRDFPSRNLAISVQISSSNLLVQCSQIRCSDKNRNIN